MARIVSSWRNLLRRDRVERDLDDELRATFELLVAEKIRAGLAPADARRAARLELGSIESLKEQVRDARAGAFVDTLLRDVRYGARLLRRNPLFTLTAALSLAIGIGATTTIFSVANGLLLRSAMGVPDPDRLVDIVRMGRGDVGIEPVSYPDYVDIRERATTVEDVYAYGLELEAVGLQVGNGGAERAFASVVTTNYFDALGVLPAAGRVFGPGDSEQPGTSPIAVMSHHFWMRRFMGDPGIVGEVVRVNGQPFTIVGVAREGFRGTSVVAGDLWTPTAMVSVVHADPPGLAPRLTRRSDGWLAVGARLKSGVSRKQASAEIAAIGAARERERQIDAPSPQPAPPGAAARVPPEGSAVRDRPATAHEWSVEAASPIPYGVRTLAAMFFALLMGIVSVVLAIACANVAGILLTRATVRRREIALRAAIGAARGRVVRQLLTETVLLFLLGAALGLALARGLTSLLIVLLPAFPVPVNLSVPLDARVVAFSLGLALLAALLSGLAPALQAAKADVVSTLKDEAQGPLDRLRLRHAFVVAQVALSMLLVVTAGILVRGFETVTSVDRGFDSRQLHVATLDVSMAGYSESAGLQFARDLVDRVRALPGVEAATVANRAPASSTVQNTAVTVPGVATPDGSGFFALAWTIVEPGYFSTLRIPQVAGRDFETRDRAGSELVAIVSESAARRFWPGEDAIGRSLTLATTRTTVRVIAAARDVDLRPSQMMRGNPLALYVPLQQHYVPGMTMIVRATAGHNPAAALRNLVSSMDPSLPVLSAQPLVDVQNGPVETQLRISAGVAGTVGILGLFLAAIGIYGVTAYTVIRRTREIGIRLSLGAGRAEVVRLVLRQGMKLVAIGSSIGMGMAVAAGRLLSGMYFAIPAPDAPMLAGAAVLFIAIGLVATYVPVRRATSIRAMDALRYE